MLRVCLVFWKSEPQCAYKKIYVGDYEKQLNTSNPGILLQMRLLMGALSH